jgi:hypothetical protein
MLIYLEDMEKCLGVIPQSHLNKNAFNMNITDQVKNLVCNKGDVILFNANLIHVGTIHSFKNDHLRIQMKVSHKDDLEILSYYQNYNKVLKQENHLPSYIRKAQMNLSCMFPFVSNLTQKENITNLPTMILTMLLFTPTKIENFTNYDSQLKPETFITRLQLPDTYLDPTYSCYGDITENIKALCDSSYDIYGNPKTRNTTWDHPCIVDSDCPYFQANKNYPNTRGGCMDSGVCELPIGVKRVSYRQYDDKDINAPFCYGCDAYDTTCCSKKKNPDYAFANDTNDRVNADLDLKTTIKLN